MAKNRSKGSDIPNCCTGTRWTHYLHLRARQSEVMVQNQASMRPTLVVTRPGIFLGVSVSILVQLSTASVLLFSPPIFEAAVVRTRLPKFSRSVRRAAHFDGQVYTLVEPG